MQIQQLFLHLMHLLHNFFKSAPAHYFHEFKYLLNSYRSKTIHRIKLVRMNHANPNQIKFIIPKDHRLL